MFQTPPRESKWVSWLFVVSWVLLVFATIYFARDIQAFATEHFDRIWFRRFALIFLGSLSLMGLVYYLRNRNRLKWHHILSFIVITGIFFGWTFTLTASPEEAMHFVQYGILSFLLYRAMTHHLRDPTIFPAVMLIGGLIGTYDEIIQWVTPERYWDYRDVWLNFGAVGLIQLAICFGIAPGIICEKAGWHSVPRLTRLAGGFVLLLTACLLNTPPRIHAYTERMPFLDFLRTNPSTMTEYGYLYHDPEIGRFKSRFSPEELKKYDREHVKKSAAILNRYPKPEQFFFFLQVYTPGNAPFVHEAMVHIARRNRWRQNAWKYKQTEPETYRKHYSVAWRENRILEKYYPKTFKRSFAVFSSNTVSGLASQLIDEPDYFSPVSENLITQFKEWQIWAFMGGILFFLGVIDRLAVLRSAQRVVRNE